MEKSINQAKKALANENLFFSDSLRQLIADFPLRSQEIVFSRYGILSSRAMTLEEIGKKYHITRERVRQIIREALKKIKDKKSNPIFAKIQDKLVLALRAKGGIIEEQQLLSELGKDNASERSAARFFLECVDDIVSNEIKGELKFSYALKDFEIEKWKRVKNAAVNILKDQKKPLTFGELAERLKKDAELSNEAIVCYLEVSEEIKKNVFGKWGLAEWKEISPKGTREKAYLILKETGKPLHFREIAKEIDEYHLNKKKTHFQTVHNELIKDDNFVLVGRGIYALVEWGYKKGTVKDVIEDILKQSSQTLSREAILAKVLEVRNVKASTVVINLNNYFSKLKDGTYNIKK